MRSLAFPILIFVSAATLGAQQPTFGTHTRIVPLMATVTDAHGRLLPGLERDEFTILDDGKPQEITLFQNAAEPFTVVVMLDYSASMAANIDRLEAATEQFIVRMLPGDRGQVGSFNQQVHLSGTFTEGRDDLISALHNLPSGYTTRLYDAIDASIDMLTGVDGRRVVLVFTDGDDTDSAVGLDYVLDRARDEEVMIYVIGLESEYFDGRRTIRVRPDSGAMKLLAQETGGGYFNLRKTDDLPTTFARVAEELHNQYTLGFAPTALDGRTHMLTLRLKRPGMTARARRAYVASPERSLSTD